MIKQIPQPKVYPIVKNVLELDTESPVQSLMRLADTYGGIYKFQVGNMTSVVISDPDLVNEVCDESRFDKKVHKPLEKIRDFGGDGLFTAYTEEENWGKAHRILVPAFGPAAVKTMFPQMLDIAEQLLLKWERLGPEAVLDVPDNMTRLTLDTIALCAFDFRFNSFYNEKMHPFVDAMINALQEASLHIRRLPMINRLKLVTKRNYEREIGLMNTVAADIIKDRRKLPPEQWPDDLLSLMLRGKDPLSREGLDDSNITYQMLTFLIAGHETTSGMLSFALCLLLKNPDKLSKAQEEVDRVLGHEKPRFEHLNKLVYIDQVLKESLRLWPTAPLFGLYPYEDTVIGGQYEIKKNEAILVLLPSLHRSSKTWKGDVNAFEPERFDSENMNTVPPNAYKPFGNGQRACIGRPFAMQEATIVLAMMLQRFNIYEHDPGYQLKIKESLTLKPDGFFIKVAKRERGNRDSDAISVHSEETVKESKAIASVNKHHTPLLVLFGSNSGTSQDFAYRITKDGTTYGYDTKMASLDSFSGNLPATGAVIIVTASYEGLPPDNARKFVNWLRSAQDKNLQDVRYAVFGCGNTDWTKTYQAVPTYIDHRLTELGAKRLMQRGEGDAKHDLFGSFDQWYELLWAELAHHFSVEVNTIKRPGSYAIDIVNDISAHILNEPDMRVGTVIINEELTDRAQPGIRSKRHLQIELPQGMSYRTGDYLSVLPLNPRAKVLELLKRFHLEYDSEMIINTDDASVPLPKGYPVKAGDLLSQYVELNQIATQKQIHLLGEYTLCPPEKMRLLQYAEDKQYNEEVLSKRLNLLDLLKLNPACELPFEVFLEMLPAMKPRRYSISSSPLWNKEHCTLTVAVTDAIAFSGLGRYQGTASTYLAGLAAGSKIIVQVKPSPETFHLPQDINRPVIMIGAGSGIAPFRGFIQERAIQKSSGETVGEMLLFFGCRAENADYLYHQQLQEWEKEKVVSVYPSFSAGPDHDMVYVQHSVWKHRDEIKRLLDNGAIIYLCGDGSYMAPAVRETLIKIYQEIIRTDFETSWHRWEEEVEKKHRFVTDIFE
ncbi:MULTISPECIES: bifunctional cytochrome P450/NADPH--P450 reductase [Chryseobacterium]|uniref:Bifunctional cytochrome P450/NADPH--P450 reductase n=1 Tax=Chryseobacterium camelliae TaxID=1265445 RepID=A0ABU0TDT9_9FLAO|nr:MULTISPECIES: cytochrome P450 [Chryseobacterium]MDT3406974.1 cytochrome P450/NADPH-cytochrome P450 reductase [Pseudacidovorax intermedius]MDQ1095233.1 cytochrome P450/NADPH-cytochrome P450 reductase [Chryseobacterium camelliae]MDQ1099171.1 cytochrome P450/NADPH-cytochrome P450 reductase [Chryseobacterium sp. SORGH_AS_1048]MDR6086520.1 cytochrome P450/NADPH-cytochrome P450 reductase [Chryseobacterium sp. SORGH_AS_0909]MDR6130891.1 cytochrome P450/NADPH-cytochrome P450 reductase [Chryseobacte